MAKSTLPTKNKDLPATAGMLSEVRYELKADLRALDKKVDAVEKKLTSRIDTLESKIEEALSSVHRVQALFEEHRSESRIVFEALQGFMQRMDRIETRQDGMEQVLRRLAQTR